MPPKSNKISRNRPPSTKITSRAKIFGADLGGALLTFARQPTTRKRRGIFWQEAKLQSRLIFEGIHGAQICAPRAVTSSVTSSVRGWNRRFGRIGSRSRMVVGSRMDPGRGSGSDWAAHCLRIQLALGLYSTGSAPPPPTHPPTLVTNTSGGGLCWSTCG